MPRVHHVKKAAKDNPVAKAGEPYYWWKFRYGGKRFSKTYPRASQLTNSEFLSTIYGILEEIEDYTVESNTCEHCDGTGNTQCGHCGGSNTEDTVHVCRVCEGTGEVACTECDGDGHSDDWQSDAESFKEDIESQLETLADEQDDKHSNAPEGLEESPTFEMIRERGEMVREMAENLPDPSDFDDSEEWLSEMQSTSYDGE